MDVPFLSSGAMSRAHYALVRKIELATAPSQVNQIVLAEIETIRGRFARSASMKQTKEYLITLLYCFMTLENTEGVDLEFAFSHAVNLAEAGDTVQNKRIGYLYCAEMMPKEHELQLMLVNTLRKDLEAPDVPRICLGLEALIRSPSEHAIPAVQDRVHDLLAHNSAHVRRRALLAFRTLATSNPDVLRHVIDKMSNRLRDGDSTVVGAALSTCIPLLESGLVSKDKLRPLLIKQLRTTWKNVHDISSRWLLLKYIEVLRVTGLSRNAAEILLDVVHTCSRHRPFPSAIVHECFEALAAADIKLVVEIQSTAKTTFVSSIRHLLLSQAPNDIYLFITCLNYLDSALWSGSKTDIPAVLEAWEVERVIALLDFPDVSIRKKTLQVLLKVDRSLVEAHHTRLLQVDRSSYTPLKKDDAAKRILEVIHVLTDSIGEEYAHNVKTLIDVLQGDLSRDEPPLFESIVEDILTNVRNGSADFRSSCLGALFVLFDDDMTKTSPTITVILSALACEHLESSLLPPSHLLQGLASRLSSNGAAIQDALLLSMLRVAAECDEISDSILATVRKIQEQAGRYIRRRCEQFITLSQARSTLRTILSSAKSSSLPDFMLALESYNRDQTRNRATSPPRVVVERPSSRASSQASSHTPGKLRYTAYDAPKLTAKLRRVPSNGSVAKSDSSHFVGQEREDALSRTITAGDLTLASEQIELQALTKSPRQTATTSSTQIIKDDAPSKSDLIALDSPFLTEPPSAPAVSVTSSVAELDFEGVWNKLHGANLRGWCDSPIDVAVRRLQSIQRRMRVTAADQPPFQGDLKILICPELLDNEQEGYAALRLREGEEDSCLWHLRCEEGGLRSTIRTLLTDA